MNYRFIYEKTRDGVTETETIVQTQEGFNKYNRAPAMSGSCGLNTFPQG